MLNKRYENFNIVNYVNTLITPKISKLLELELVFKPFTSGIFSFSYDEPIVHQRYKEKICTTGKDFDIYPNSKSCMEKTDKLTTYCSTEDPDELIRKYKMQKRKKLEPKILEIIEKLERDEPVPNPDLVHAQRIILGKAMPITPSTREFILLYRASL